MPMPSVNPTGVTAIETIVGAVMVSEVDCDTPPNDAEMLVEPVFRALARPEASMVATPVLEDAQVTSEVKSALLPSL